MRESYQGLDPVLLLKELEHLQDQFWEYPYRKPSSSISSVVACESISRDTVPPKLIVGAPLLQPETSTMVQKTPQVYRRTKKPTVPHTWRTRKDPFVEVWGQVQLQLDIHPGRTAKEMFQELQQRYPGKFSDGQLRTLQRRVKQRRREQMYSNESIQRPWTNVMPQLH